jgi:hypothetical protein
MAIAERLGMSARLAVAALALAGSIARADDLSQLNAAVDDAVAHNRAALSHLRAASIPFATIELVRLRESFDLLLERYGGELRSASGENPDFATILVDVPLRIVTAQMMIDFGRPDIAANSLLAICRSLEILREPAATDPAAACETDGSR